VITLIVLAFSLGMNGLLIPRIGLYGAAFTAILSGILMSLLNYFQSQEYFPIRYELKKTGIIMAVSIGIVLVSLLFSQWSLLFRIITKVILMMTFPLLLYLFGFYEPVEIERLKGLWKKWRKPRYWYANIIEITKKQSMDSLDV